MNDQLDEILGSIKYSTIDGMIPLDPFYTAEAKAKLQRLIAEARIDEAEHLLGLTYVWPSSEWTVLFHRRIAELTRQDKELEE